MTKIFQSDQIQRGCTPKIPCPICIQDYRLEHHLIPEYSSNDQEIQLWLLIQSIACQYASPGLTVNATWRLAIVDGKPENFILLYILLLWSYNKIICLLLWSCWGSWLRWLWYHGVTIGCAIMHSIHRWTDWLQNKKKKTFYWAHKYCWYKMH